MGKLKLKNTVTIQQEKLLAEKEEMLQKERKEAQDAGQSLRAKEQEVVTACLPLPPLLGLLCAQK